MSEGRVCGSDLRRLFCRRAWLNEECLDGARKICYPTHHVKHHLVVHVLELHTPLQARQVLVHHFFELIWAPLATRPVLGPRAPLRLPALHRAARYARAAGVPSHTVELLRFGHAYSTHSTYSTEQRSETESAPSKRGDEALTAPHSGVGWWVG